MDKVQWQYLAERKAGQDSVFFFLNNYYCKSKSRFLLTKKNSMAILCTIHLRD